MTEIIILVVLENTGQSTVICMYYIDDWLGIDEGCHGSHPQSCSARSHMADSGGPLLWGLRLSWCYYAESLIVDHCGWAFWRERATLKTPVLYFKTDYMHCIATEDIFVPIQLPYFASGRLFYWNLCWTYFHTECSLHVRQQSINI